VQVRGLLGHHELLADALGRHHPADAEARGRDLGEGPQEQGLARQPGEQGLLVLAQEAQLAVGVVLHEDHAAAGQEFGHGLALLGAVGHARGILEIGHGVEEAGPVPEHAGQVLEHRAVIHQLHGAPVRPEEGKGLDGPEIAGPLDGHGRPALDEHLADHVQALLGARGDEDVLGVHGKALLLGVALGDQGPQLGVALGGGVLQGGAALFAQDRGRGLGHLLHGEEGRIGQAPGKGDDRRVGRDLEDFADERGMHAVHAAGELRTHGEPPDERIWLSRMAAARKSGIRGGFLRRGGARRAGPR